MTRTLKGEKSFYGIVAAAKKWHLKTLLQPIFGNQWETTAKIEMTLRQKQQTNTETLHLKQYLEIESVF